jgi:diguanylate cyclase (GGDEF)-like protein
MRAPHVGDVHEAMLLAKLLPPSSTGEPQRFVDFAAPIRIDGEVRGVIALHGGWDWTRSVIESQLPDDVHALAMDLLILDRNGIVIYAPIGHANESIRLGDNLASIVQRPTTTAAIRHWPDGNDYLTSVARLQPREPASDLGWLIVARAPKTLAYAPVKTAFFEVAGVGLVAAAIAMLLAWLVSGTICKPLSAIERAARDVLSGKEGATIPTCIGNAEVTRLSTALIGMTEELETRVREHDQLARFDPLTKILNRRGFQEQMEIAMVNAKRRGMPLSLVAIDIDHFKDVNDEYGHDVGDTVLQQLACILKMRFRESDIIARMGGEEFLVLLQDTDLAAAACVAGTLVAHVAATPFGAGGRITISCGLARVSPGEGAAIALKRADRGLYRAKRTGRNRICALEEEVTA